MPTVTNEPDRNDETRPKTEKEEMARGCAEVQKAAGYVCFFGGVVHGGGGEQRQEDERGFVG